MSHWSQASSNMLFYRWIWERIESREFQLPNKLGISLLTEILEFVVVASNDNNGKWERIQCG